MRSSDYMDGKRNGIKWAVTWLHERAKEMDDPWAKQLLNVTAADLGSDAKHGWLAKVRAMLADKHASPPPTSERSE